MQSGVIVVGAGVVGLSAALALQARGLKVTVLDREGPAAGASAGNAGAFALPTSCRWQAPASCARPRNGCWIRLAPCRCRPPMR